MKIDIHSHQASLQESDDIRVYCHADYKEPLPSHHGPICVGLHPWYLPENEEEWQKATSFLRENFQRDNFFALGECGLDRVKGPGFQIQLEFLNLQLELAQGQGIGLVILHCVRAYPDMQKVIKESPFKGKFIFHDYGANKEITEQLIQNPNIFFSLGRALNRDKFIKESLPLLPKNRVFLETDDDNEVSIEERYQSLDKLWALEATELEKLLSANYDSLRS